MAPRQIHDKSSFEIPWSESCDPIALFSTTYETRDERAKLFFLERVDQRQFEEARQKFGYQVGFMLYDVPVNLNTTWDDFKNKRAEILKEVQFQSEEEVRVLEYYNYLSAEAASALTACLNKNNKGLSVFVKSVTSQVHVVKVKFNTTVADNARRTLTVKEVDRATGKETLLAKHRFREDLDWEIAIDVPRTSNEVKTVEIEIPEENVRRVVGVVRTVVSRRAWRRQEIRKWFNIATSAGEPPSVRGEAGTIRVSSGENRLDVDTAKVEEVYKAGRFASWRVSVNDKEFIFAADVTVTDGGEHSRLEGYGSVVELSPYWTEDTASWAWSPPALRFG